MFVSVFKSLEDNSLCWNQNRVVNTLVFVVYPLSLWKMRLFITIFEIPVGLWLCKGIEWAPAFLLGILIPCHSCDKETVPLIVLWHFHPFWEASAFDRQTSLLSFPLPSFESQRILALTSWWQAHYEHLKYGCLVTLCPFQCLILLKLPWDTSRLLWSSASRDVLLVGMEELYFLGLTWVGSSWMLY